MTDDITELRLRSERGLVPAQVVLGIYLLEGSHPDIPRDYEEALRWLSAASARGAPRACLHLGRMYKDGLGVDLDLSAARGLFERAASGDEYLAFIEMGRLEALAGNVREARIWYGRALEQRERVDSEETLEEAASFLAQHPVEPGE